MNELQIFSNPEFGEIRTVEINGEPWLVGKDVASIMKNNCTNLYFLSTIACQLAECLDEKELEMLSSDLTALGYMIESLLAHKCTCKDE